MNKIIKIADLFCGAGGSSKGAADAGRYLGYQVQMTAINHWDVAIATHTANMKKARHLCTPLELIRPQDLYDEGELDLLWASPECTHHSIARGGRPISDQSRSTAFRVTEWAEALRPRIILVENVPEFRTWGPLIRKRVKTNKRHKNGKPICKLAWRPDPKKKGAIFKAWIANLEAIGYTVAHRVLCAADYGDPTTRRRLFIQAVRGNTKIIWPNPTHAPRLDKVLLDTRAPYVSAREIIDWDLESQSIFERKKQLCNNTLRRIEIGLWKYGLKSFIVPQHRGYDRERVKSVDDPLATVTGTARGEGLCEPFLVRMQGKSNAESVKKPISPVCTQNKHGLVEPFLVPNFGERKGQPPRVHGIDKPLPTVTSHGGGCLVEPFLIQTAHDGTSPSRTQPVSDPLKTVCGHRGDSALIEPFIVRLQNHGTAEDIDEPVGTVRAKGTHHAVAEPYLIRYNGNHKNRKDGFNRNQDVDEPIGTLDTSNRYGVAEPFLIKYYGTAKGAQSINEPLDTVTAKARHALVKPILEIDGNRYILDIHFRMLQPKELAAAQGFPEDWQFAGNKTEVVKQIGNAVPYHTARALVLAALSQQSDITPFLTNKKRRNIA